MVVESGKNGTYFPPFLEDQGVPVCSGHRVPEVSLRPLRVTVQDVRCTIPERDTTFTCVRENGSPSRVCNHLEGRLSLIVQK